MTNPTDEVLMQQVQRGDLDKMRILFDRYQVRIYNYCLQLCGDREASKDLTQEVFYKLLKFRNTYRSTRFSTWLYSIARNLCYDYYKAQRKQEKQVDEFRTLHAQAAVFPEEPFGNLHQLNHALNQLKMADKELIIMSKYQGLKYQEIAEITNSSVGAVRTKTHRAIHKLKDLYFANMNKYEL